MKGRDTEPWWAFMNPGGINTQHEPEEIKLSEV